MGYNSGADIMGLSSFV